MNGNLTNDEKPDRFALGHGVVPYVRVEDRPRVLDGHGEHVEEPGHPAAQRHRTQPDEGHTGPLGECGDHGEWRVDAEVGRDRQVDEAEVVLEQVGHRHLVQLDQSVQPRREGF
nr:hypothetical protein [Streptomyces davaonensis]